MSIVLFALLVGIAVAFLSGRTKVWEIVLLGLFGYLLGQYGPTQAIINPVVGALESILRGAVR